MSASTYILSLDQGTTSTTALLIDKHGHVVVRACVELQLDYPRSGWVECDPEKIWQAAQQAIDRVLRQTPARARIVALGITNQRETSIIWDRQTGNAIYPAIVWQCRRTTDMCATLKQRGVEAQVRAKTGLVLDPYFSATKISWVLAQIEGARARAERGELAFGTVDSWLLWKLSAGTVHKTDYTNASRTLLFNIDTLVWDEALLSIFQIPPALLPEACPSLGVFGTVKEGTLAGIPVAGMAGDQQASMFGQLCVQAGMAKNTYGTGCFLVLHTGAQRIASRRGLLTTLVCNPSATPAYALEGSVFVAGAAVQWLRDGLGIIETAAEAETEARRVADTHGVTVVPAFTGLGAPYWDAAARGAIFGLTRATRREHVIRATLEAIALQVADVASAMLADTGAQLKCLRVDGGAAANDFLMQFQADILGIEIERPRSIETTGLGVAYLAGLACGMWQDITELESQRTGMRLFAPQMTAEARTRKLSQWQDAVQRVR